MIVSLTTLAGFTATVLVIEATPGPNMGWLAVVSASEGRRAGFAAVAGVGLGLLLIGLAAAAGLGAVILATPWVYQALRWVGAAYLLWLAYDAWNAAGETSPGAFGGAAPSYFRHFRRGLIVNLLNPKAAVFYIAVLPSFIDGSSNVVAQAFFLTVYYVVIATGVHGLIVAFAGTARPYLEAPTRMRGARRIMAVLIAVIAIWFAISAGR